MSKQNNTHSENKFLSDCFGYQPTEKIKNEKDYVIELKKIQRYFFFKYLGLTGISSLVGCLAMIKARSPTGDALRMILRQTNPQYRFKHNIAMSCVALSICGLMYANINYYYNTRHNPYSLGLIPNIDEQLKIDDINKL